MASDTKGKYEVAGDGNEAQKSGFCNFVYDSDTGRFMGRTLKSWISIIGFYIVYYSCLAGFFMGMISVFLFGIIEEDRPHLTGKQSLLKFNPGMGFRPQPDPESALISFTAGSNATYGRYVKNLKDLYSTYQKPISSANIGDCETNSTDGGDPMKVCPFDWRTQMPNCLPDNAFGYANAKPCVVLKLNRVFGWLPEPKDPAWPNPTVECFGDNAADAETIGSLSYEPSGEASAGKKVGYFSQVYFPYLKQNEYQSPLVALIFDNLPANTLVMVECRLGNLANVYYDRMDRDAMVRFDIFMQK